MMDMEDDKIGAASSSSASAAQYVTCGDTVTADAGCLMGHGTMQVDGHQNELDIYNGEVGDVVVGRIVELGDKRWKVDVGGRAHSILLLAAVNLPGGIQRRRTDQDSLNMRAFFTENDVISAEVQKIRHDGAISLHTRNLKYGKLSNGSFVQVPSNLVKRCKHHFQILSEEIGVEVILGMNGYIWVQEAPVEKQRTSKNVKEEEEGVPNTYTPVTAAGRERVCRVRNSILALARSFMPIYNVTISDVYLASVQLGLPAKDMLSSQEIVMRITQSAMERTQG